MAKDLTATVDGKIAAQEQMPLMLVELYLNAGTLRFVAAKNNVTFGGTVYTAKFMKISKVDQSAEGQIGRIAVSFDNITGDMGAYIDDEDFSGKQLIIKRVWYGGGALASAADHNEYFNGFCEEVEEISKTLMTVPVTYGKPLQRQTLLKIYQRNCGHNFGDTVCNQLSRADLTSLCVLDTAVVSGSTDYIIDATKGKPLGSGVTDYWKFGTVDLWVKGSGVTYTRDVKTFYSGTSKTFFSPPLSVAIDNTYSYNIYKGCSKMWSSCGAESAYGPLSSNTPQYGGFLHLSTNVGGQS